MLFLLGGWRPGMAVTSPYGLWNAVLLDSLYACFAVAATIPLRPAVIGPAVIASSPSAGGVLAGRAAGDRGT